MKDFYRPNLGDHIVIPDDLWEKIVELGDLNLTGKKLNLACGHDYREGWVNLDGDRGIRADVYSELDDKNITLPFPAGEFDVILASHIFEHIWYLPQLKAECTRILSPKGKMIVIVPAFDSDDAWGDDTHCRAFQESSFSETFWPGLEVAVYMPTQVNRPEKPIPLKWFTVILQQKGEHSV